MLSLYNLLAAAICLTTTVTATPVANPVAADAATPAATCKPLSTFNAKFDTLPVGSSPPSGFGDAVWNGWTVVSGASVGYHPKSGANLIQAGNAETSSISVNNNVVMEIQSFYFGCTAFYPGLNEVFPESCSIMVTTLPYTNAFQVATAGPFTSDNAFSYDSGAGNLTRVDLNVASSEFYFQVISGLEGPTLFLDNVVIVNQNNCS